MILEVSENFLKASIVFLVAKVPHYYCSKYHHENLGQFKCKILGLTLECQNKSAKSVR